MKSQIVRDFFESVYLYGQLTNLLLQLSVFLFSLLVICGSSAFEQLGNPVEKLLFPIADHLVLGRNLVEDINALDRLQCDSSLKLRRMFFSLFFYNSYPSHLKSPAPYLKPHNGHCSIISFYVNSVIMTAIRKGA